LVVTSTVTLLEVLVHPLRSNNRELATEYRDILLNSKLMTLEVSNAIAEQAARLIVPNGSKEQAQKEWFLLECTKGMR